MPNLTREQLEEFKEWAVKNNIHIDDLFRELEKQIENEEIIEQEMEKEREKSVEFPDEYTSYPGQRTE